MLAFVFKGIFQFVKIILRVIAEVYQIQCKGKAAATAFSVVEIHIRPSVHYKLVGHLDLRELKLFTLAYEMLVEMLL